MAAARPDQMLTKVGSNLTFLKNWVQDEEGTFKHTMELLAEERPERFADLYLRAVGMVESANKAPSGKTNLNVNINADLDKLKALAGTVDVQRRVESETTKTEYHDYEEI